VILDSQGTARQLLDYHRPAQRAGMLTTRCRCAPFPDMTDLRPEGRGREDHERVDPFTAVPWLCLPPSGWADRLRPGVAPDPPAPRRESKVIPRHPPRTPVVQRGRGRRGGCTPGGSVVRWEEPRRLMGDGHQARSRPASAGWRNRAGEAYTCSALARQGAHDQGRMPAEPCAGQHSCTVRQQRRGAYVRDDCRHKNAASINNDLGT
jgi:hypothetical protein